MHPILLNLKTCMREFKAYCTTVFLLLCAYVVVQFSPWFKFNFLLFLGMVMYDNEFETEENKI